MSKPGFAVIMILLVASAAQATRHPAATVAATVAVLDLTGRTEVGERLALLLSENFRLVPSAQARAAARGVGYKGSLNLSLAEARDLGAAVGCDFFVAGEARTLRRTSSTRPLYFESYASLFFVSSRTGRLLLWDQPAAEAATPEEAEQLLDEELRARAARYAAVLRAAQEVERREKLLAAQRDAAAVEEAPEEGSPASVGFRAPQPYRRLRPDYPPAASRLEQEAVVDVLVELDVEGEVKNLEVMRWAGYGLNEAVAAAIRRMHFRPAMRDGQPVPIRVLLRYNFRRPAK